MEMYCVLIVVLVSQVCTFVKTHQTVDFIFFLFLFSTYIQTHVLLDRLLSGHSPHVHIQYDMYAHPLYTVQL